MKNKILILVTLLFTSLTAISQYCTPTYTTVCVSAGTNDLIDNFWTTGGTQDISNLNTSCNMQPNNYINTGIALIAQPGDVIGLNVQCGATYPQGFSIWVDWNQDFVFDPSENIYQSPNSSFNVFTSSFVIPPDLDCGNYRMRVRSKYASAGATINPCDSQTFGETEDYTVTIDECDTKICNGESHTIDLTDGLPADVISYSWSPAIYISDPFGGPIVTVSPIDTTTYTCTITALSGITTESFKILVFQPIEPDAGLDDSLCHSPLNGYQLQPTLHNNGTFFWEFESGPTSQGTPNAIFQGSNTVLNATTLTNYPGEFTYVFHEADTNDVCPIGTDTVKIFFSKETHTTTFTDPPCFGGADGSIQITSTGLLGAVDYSYDGGVTYTTTFDSLGFTSGDYTVISRDYLGCEAESIVTITDTLAIVLTAGPYSVDPLNPTAPDSTICQNGTATLYASAINGTTYDYIWSHTLDVASVQQISPLLGTFVNVHAVSELGCISNTWPIEIGVHGPISNTITATTDTDTICPGYDSELTVISTGGFQGYNYVWTANGTSYNDIDNIINMNPIIETEYCVTVSDVCETTPKDTCFTIIMREVPSPQIFTDTIEGCNPSIIEFSDITQYNMAETQTAQINWLVDGTVYNNPLFDHLFENVGEYDVQLEIYTQFGCHNTTIYEEYITIHDIPSASFYAISNPTTIFNTEVDMINNTQGNALTFQWSNPGGIPATSNLQSPTIVYPEGLAADYPVELIVTNEFNCTDQTTDIVHILSDVIIYAPNAFTPDDDHLNNDWRVYIDGININEFHLIMFNRWGEVVWESYDPEGVWDGNYGGNDTQEGTYIWTLITKDATSDKKYEFKGQVTVIR